MARRRICFVTGSRADYGLLSVVMEEVKKAPGLALQLVATGTHLSHEFGLTSTEIEQDGFSIDARVEMLISSDTPVGIAKSIGVGICGFADAFNLLKPDLIVVLGDRFEILAAVQAALVAKIPVGHIAGGDVTEGAFDESIRHSITKMSHLHFVTHEDAARRVHQLGENPDHIFTVGSPAIDRIRRMKKIGRRTLEKDLKFRFKKRNILVTYHPVTLDRQSAGSQFGQLLRALDELGKDLGILFTMPNADTQGRSIIRLMEEFVARHPHATAVPSLGQLRYLSAVSCVDAVVGNSSSGIYEVPSLGKPTVNIGDRQKGRLQAASVVNCAPRAGEITKAIRRAFAMDCTHTINPYGNGDSAQQIVAVLRSFRDFSTLIKKPFFELMS